nr:hypothetical protein [Tanacetum cinerariifolium]
MKCQFLDKRLNELTMMVLKRQTESCDMLFHMVMTDMKLLVVETETADITADDVDTVLCSTDVGRSKQVDLKFVHSSIEPHFHDIHVDRDKHEVDRLKFHKCVDMIHGRMRASKPKTMQDAIEIATKLRNKKISTLVECQTENKKRLDNTSKNNQNQQQPNKRQNSGRAYTVRHGEKKHYNGAKPLCSKCNYHHDGPCAPKCHKCNRFGHLARDCRSPTNANTSNIQKGTGASQKATCYECGNQGHYRRDCPEQKNQNHENQIKSTKARGVMHAYGGGENKQDLNNIEDEIEA